MYNVLCKGVLKDFQGNETVLHCISVERHFQGEAEMANHATVSC